MMVHNVLLFVISRIGSELARSQAYLDPGSGSFILQILVASIMGALLFVGIRWRQFKGFLRSRFSKDNSTDTSEDKGSNDDPS